MDENLLINQPFWLFMLLPNDILLPGQLFAVMPQPLYTSRLRKMVADGIAEARLVGQRSLERRQPTVVVAEPSLSNNSANPSTTP